MKKVFLAPPLLAVLLASVSAMASDLIISDGNAPDTCVNRPGEFLYCKWRSIVVLVRQNGSEVQITDPIVTVVIQPKFSPDGTLFAAYSWDSNNQEIFWVYDLKNMRTREILHTGHEAVSAYDHTWVDDRTLVFDSYDQQGGNLQALDVVTGEVSVLPNTSILGSQLYVGLQGDGLGTLFCLRQTNSGTSGNGDYAITNEAMKYSGGTMTTLFSQTINYHRGDTDWYWYWFSATPRGLCWAAARSRSQRDYDTVMYVLSWDFVQGFIVNMEPLPYGSRAVPFRNGLLYGYSGIDDHGVGYEEIRFAIPAYAFPSNIRR